jgi:epoxyqueuosine reductase
MVIIMATFTRKFIVNFLWRRKKYEVIIPPQYYDNGISKEDMINVIRRDIIKQSGYKIESATTVHLKQLAVRSGLGKYERNNLCYVDEMGTFITL